ncbi:MAG: peroxiredoxin [Rhizobiales bacterium]|nr:peroxiredoxin [Hyphomicrobiales bacterium]MBI3673608.1 peroxiredoxin [Hyphomicrobiales bacterium]
MTIKPGDRLPAAEFTMMTGDGQQKLSTDVLFAGRKVVLFAVPGAFTPTCSNNHMPGFVRQAAAIKARGVDTIACTAVNDHHVMTAWGKATGADGKILMLADGNGDFARALGLNVDRREAGMGERSRRYSMIVEDGVVKTLNVEDKPGINVSGAETILAQL